MTEENMDKQLERIRKAYNLTVEQYKKGINSFDGIPEEIRNSSGFKDIIADKGKLNSSAPDIKEYLNPESGMRFLDAGCCANLANYRLDNMFKLEEYLGRPNIPKSRSAFEQIMGSLFLVERVDDSRVMLNYFVRTIK